MRRSSLRQTGFNRGVLDANNTVPAPMAPPSIGWSVDSQNSRSGGIYTVDNRLVSGAYDAAGDATSIQLSGSSAVGITYDAWGRVAKMSTDRQTVYSYDTLGRRISAKNFPLGANTAGTPANGTQSFYSGQNLIEERDLAGNVTSQYVWSAAGPSMVVLRDQGAGRLYFQQDAEGSTTSVTDAGGAVQERYAYGANGQPVAYKPDWTSYTLGQDASGNAVALDSSASRLGVDLLWHGQRFHSLYQANVSGANGGGLYESQSGGQWYDPQHAVLVQPDRSALAGGQNAYDSTGGETGFAGWFDRNAGYIAGASAIGIGATLTVATGGLALAYAPELLGLANGAIITAYGAATSPLGTYALGLAATGTVAGMIANPDFRDQVLSSTDPAHFAELPLAAGQFLFKNGPAGLQAAGAWAAEAGPIFASGFMRGANAPIGAYYFASFGGEGVAGAARIANGVRAGFADLTAEGAIVREGTFGWIELPGYPEFLPQPDAQLRLLDGDEYDAALSAKKAANAAIRRANPELYEGMEIHEITPVKFGGSPTDPLNKIAVPASWHRQFVTPWWNTFRDSLQSGV